MDVFLAALAGFHAWLAPVLNQMGFWLLIAFGVLCLVFGGLAIHAAFEGDDSAVVGLGAVAMGVAAFFVAGSPFFMKGFKVEPIQIAAEVPAANTPAGRAIQARWAALEIGDTLRAPNGVLHRKGVGCGASKAFAETRVYLGIVYGRNNPGEPWVTVLENQASPVKSSSRIERWVAPPEDLLADSLQSSDPWTVVSETPTP